ncbi:hypothetical protein QEH40_gp02 [Microbacterium phage OscarSo]|uniref:Uncharacterized protein n=1 Tax=Microbacterium phage OscarSo TaxID=2985324 RepID=A0A9X9K2R3_9CAUD|nr:hypothetical protein QEH40_gp02 [Microbacterium phage OscarSo]UYL87123.1 hypothetical protein SEA_OSCARSO_2 [Microbacterium phage OscarSo]
MPLYSAAMDLGLAMPLPSHALTPAAEEAREAMRRYGHERKLEREVAKIVTDVGNPKPVPFLGAKTTAAAKRLAAKAKAAGFEVIVREYREGCVVEGIDRARKLGFRAYWHRGKADGATWHSGGRDRYELVRDDRPVGVNKLTRTALAGKRGAGMGRVRLKLIESPRGIPLKITELEKRITT